MIEEMLKLASSIPGKCIFGGLSRRTLVSPVSSSGRMAELAEPREWPKRAERARAPVGTRPEGVFHSSKELSHRIAASFGETSSGSYWTKGYRDRVTEARRTSGYLNIRAVLSCSFPVRSFVYRRMNIRQCLSNNIHIRQIRASPILLTRRPLIIVRAQRRCLRQTLNGTR